MRIVICGDSHIGAVYGLGGPNGTGGNTRVDDYEKTLNYIVDYCIENKADAFIQTGDAFDKRNPAPEHVEVMNRALKKLSMNNIMAVVLMGNHDYKKTGPSYTSSISTIPAKDMPNVRVVLSKEIISLSKGEESVNLLLLPFLDRRLLPGKSTKEDSEIYEKQIISMINSAVEHPIVAVGHNFFYEGTYNDYGGAEVLVKPSAFKGCDLVAMGHLHQFRVINKKDPIALYTGSMEKINFGDANVQKVFIDYDTEEKKVKIQKTPTVDLIDSTIDLSEYTFDNIEDSISEKLQKLDVNEKIVRVNLKLSESALGAVTKSAVEKMLYDNGAHFVSRVLFEQVYKKIVRSSSILEEKDSYKMFENFVKGQEYSEDLEKEILSTAKNIIG